MNVMWIIGIIRELVAIVVLFSSGQLGGHIRHTLKVSTPVTPLGASKP
jgi:hypothetical protein